jgi:predicted dehydrogenase
VEPVRVGIVGLGFGKEFIPIYRDFAKSEVVAICKRNKAELDAIGDEFGISARYTKYEDMLKNDEIDAIHVVTPILDHASMSVAALESGKHCACTVPMGVTIEELEEIIRAKNASGKYYMMMETAVYTREFLYVKELAESGKLGRIQFLRGSHIQNMGLEGWPEYWKGFPPMHYGTHAIGPLLALAKTRAESVVCHGSGSISKERAEKYGSPFAVETATFKLENSNIVAEAARALYETVRQYRESFDVYGDKLSWEWSQVEDDGHVQFDGGEEAHKMEAPDTDKLLSDDIAKYTLREQILDADHVSFIQGAGHGGSHPHMVQEFIDAIVEEREPFPDAIRSADWTAAGICAHESALHDAARVEIPDFSKLRGAI